MMVVNYLQEVQAELKRVVWPSRKQVVRLTTNVITISIIFGAFIGILDYTFTSLTQAILR